MTCDQRVALPDPGESIQRFAMLLTRMVELYTAVGHVTFVSGEFITPKTETNDQS